jgi:hypothetical protein
MKTTCTMFAASALAMAFTTAAAGQSFNLDIGQPGAGPPDTYAAAGYAGFWMSLPGTQGVNYANLVDVNGHATAARFNQIGGTQTLLANDPELAGDDATLMNDFLITHTNVENCLFFHDMEPGKYIVLLYARMPAQPGVDSRTNVDQEPGNPHLLVGGVWPGHHEEGISYSRHIAIVTATGDLGTHAGVPPGGSLPIGAALNAVQVIKVCAGDITGAVTGESDGAVDALDFLAMIGQWGACAHCDADITGPTGAPDGAVDSLDFLTMIGQWGAPGNCSVP